MPGRLALGAPALAGLNFMGLTLEHLPDIAFEDLVFLLVAEPGNPIDVVF